MKLIPRKDIIFVFIQIVLMLIYFLPLFSELLNLNFYLTSISLIIAISGFLIIIIAILQLNKNLTPFPTPKKTGALIQIGLYKYVRHPIYTGIIIASIFFGVYDESIWKIIISFALYTLFIFKSIYEESLLKKQYHEYEEYKNKTGRFFPFM